uniref:Nanos-type domain-containing protein n=1 Tax=Caenorhabditis tropicalis TaxID=1561998 RepID=A0A1I7T8T0_9PELO
MCSNVIHLQQKNCCSDNDSSAYLKSKYEAPKQLLQLRSQVKERQHRTSCSIESSDEFFSHLTSQTFPVPNRKLHLTYIEKDKRVRNMIPQQQHQQGFDRPFQYHTQKVGPSGHMVMRTPSSGFSSASSSENMLSGLSIQDTDPKVNELMMDPAAEVDLDIFLLPESRYKQPAQPSTSTSRVNLSQISGPSQNGGFMRQIAPSQAKTVMPSTLSDYSYSNIKRSSGYIDFMPTSMNVHPVTHQCTSANIPPVTYPRCNYCWKTYVELCHRLANSDPVVPMDGPWQWHSLYDGQGRVTCPRLWFAQIDRVGSGVF